MANLPHNEHVILNIELKNREDEQAPSIPRNLRLSAVYFSDETLATNLLNKILSIVIEISRYIDLQSLDGITVSCDYERSLNEIDRGINNLHTLVPTKEDAVGVAMSIGVVRENNFKTHLVLDANFAVSLNDDELSGSQIYAEDLHILAHECAHVEVNKQFDTAFPNLLLEQVATNPLQSHRWNVILSSWDEYAVCRLISDFGYDPYDNYLIIFIPVLDKTRSNCIEAISEYRVHGNIEELVESVYESAANLMKFSSYLLGTMVSTGRSIDILLKEEVFKEQQWYIPYFVKLAEILDQIYQERGDWGSFELFELLGDLLVDIVEDIGIVPRAFSDDQVYFEVPFTYETLPI